MRAKDIALLASISANVVLGAVLIFGERRADLTSLPTSQDPVATRGPHPQAGESTMQAGDVTTFFDQLTAAGLSEQEAKRGLVAWLESLAPEPASKEYWKPAYVSDARDRLARYQFREAARAALISAFGSSAADDPEFAPLFAPYRREFPFLTPAKQRAIEAIYASRDARLAAETSGNGPKAAAEATEAATAEIEKLLTASELEEFRLRASPLANQLLATGFQFSESEFRSAFQVLAASSGGPFSTATAFRIGAGADETTQKLRAVLGDRFGEYQKMQDPRYQLLTAVSQSFGVAPKQRDEAYAVITEADAAIEAINRTGPVLMPENRQKLSKIVRDREQRLRQLLGSSAYEVTARSLGLNAADPFPVGTRPRSRAVVMEDILQ